MNTKKFGKREPATLPEQVADMATKPGPMQDAIIEGAVSTVEHRGLPECPEKRSATNMAGCAYFNPKSTMQPATCNYCGKVPPRL